MIGNHSSQPAGGRLKQTMSMIYAKRESFLAQEPTPEPDKDTLLSGPQPPRENINTIQAQDDRLREARARRAERKKRGKKQQRANSGL